LDVSPGADYCTARGKTKIVGAVGQRKSKFEVVEFDKETTQSSSPRIRWRKNGAPCQQVFPGLHAALKGGKVPPGGGHRVTDRGLHKKKREQKGNLMVAGVYLMTDHLGKFDADS